MFNPNPLHFKLVTKNLPQIEDVLQEKDRVANRHEKVDYHKNPHGLIAEGLTTFSCPRGLDPLSTE